MIKRVVKYFKRLIIKARLRELNHDLTFQAISFDAYLIRRKELLEKLERLELTKK